jgi:hypothetical protein
MSDWTVTLTDQDPEGQSYTHWWGVRLEYQTRPAVIDEQTQEVISPELPGGSWSMSAPGEHWARILEAGLAGMNQEQIYALVDQYN